MQVVENRIQILGFGHRNKTFCGYQSFCGADIHSQIPDLLNLKKKKTELPLFLKATRPSKFRSVAFRLPITRDLALSFGYDACFFCKKYAQ